MSAVNNVFFNVKTLEVIELVRTAESMDEAIDFDSSQMQIFHNNLPMTQGDGDLVQVWVESGTPTITTPIWGPDSYHKRLSAEEFTLTVHAVKVGWIVTRACDVELAKATIQRMDNYMRFGTADAIVYDSVYDYAMGIQDDLTTVRDTSIDKLAQVLEVAQTLNRSEESVNCTWKAIDRLDPEDWKRVVSEIVQDTGVGRYGKSAAIGRLIQHFNEASE